MSSYACLLATMLALAPAAAHADPTHEPPKLEILAGPGVRTQWLHGDMDSGSGVRMLPSLAATVAYRISTHLALGIHANATRSSDQEFNADETIKWSVLSVDLAVAMPYEWNRFTVTPWLGRHLTRYHDDGTLCTLSQHVYECPHYHHTEWTNDFTSFGLTASFLPVRSVPVAVFLVLQAGIGRTPYDTSDPRFYYSAATLGLAYQR
jgi:hypothetical protein